MGKTKLRKRLKRALANFLHDELLELTCAKDGITINKTQSDIKVFCLEQTIDLHELNMTSNPQKRYKNVLYEMHNKFTTEILKHVKTETIDMNSAGLKGVEKIRFYLYVAEKP